MFLDRIYSVVLSLNILYEAFFKRYSNFKYALTISQNGQI